jgi:hypothetical protein
MQWYHSQAIFNFEDIQPMQKFKLMPKTLTNLPTTDESYSFKIQTFSQKSNLNRVRIMH